MTAVLKVVVTDTIQMEYVPLAIYDLSYRFMYRFVEPVETVWEMGSLPFFPSLIDEREFAIEPIDYEGRVSVPRLEAFAVRRWHRDLGPEPVEGAEWIWKVNKARVVECRFAPKKTAYRSEFRLKVGDVVKFGPYALPYEYLGDGLLGGNTPPGDCTCATHNATEPEPHLKHGCSRCCGNPEAPTKEK